MSVTPQMPSPGSCHVRVAAEGALGAMLAGVLSHVHWRPWLHVAVELMEEVVEDAEEEGGKPTAKPQKRRGKKRKGALDD